MTNLIIIYALFLSNGIFVATGFILLFQLETRMKKSLLELEMRVKNMEQKE